MKNYICLLMVTLCLSCQESDENNPSFTVPFNEAKAAVQKHIDVMTEYNRIVTEANKPILLNTPLKSFTIRSIDLVEAMGMKKRHLRNAKYDYVRLYVGLDSLSNFKLYLTPVVDADLDAQPPRAGRDKILYKKDENGNLIEDSGYVMDFAMPCPNTCPEVILPNEIL